VVGVVAGITTFSPEGRDTFISSLKHLGMDKVKKLVLVVTDRDLFSDSDIDVDSLFDCVSDSDSPSLTEVLLPFELLIDSFCPSWVEEPLDELVPLWVEVPLDVLVPLWVEVPLDVLVPL